MRVETLRRLVMSTVIGLLLMASLLTFGGCDRAEKLGEWAWGDALRARVTVMHRLPDILVLAEDGESFLRVSPEGEGNELVAVYVEVVNDETSKILLSLDSETAELDEREATSRDFYPIDPFTRGTPTEEFHEDETYYSPILWVPIELDKNYQVAGWMIFEVPEGLRFRRMVWRESDTIFIDF